MTRAAICICIAGDARKNVLLGAYAMDGAHCRSSVFDLKATQATHKKNNSGIIDLKTRDSSYLCKRHEKRHENDIESKTI